MNFTCDSILGETTKFVDLGLLPAHTTDKLKSIIGPATRNGGLTDHSNWLTSRHHIAELTKGRVIEVQVYIDYIKKIEVETRNSFELKIFN